MLKVDSESTIIEGERMTILAELGALLETLYRTYRKNDIPKKAFKNDLKMVNHILMEVIDEDE